MTFAARGATDLLFEKRLAIVTCYHWQFCAPPTFASAKSIHMVSRSDWLHANEGPREKYSADSYAAKCVLMICLLNS
eukprot:4822579-Pleurochrysis_carterae.AAC.1